LGLTNPMHNSLLLMKTFALLFAFTLLEKSVFHLDPDPAYIIPFGTSRGLTLIQATVDETSGFFILDTGISDLTLNRLYFEGTAVEKKFYGINQEGLDIQIRRVDLKINNFQTRMGAKIIDFTAIEARCDFPILGAIGTEVFEDCEIVFDYIFKEFTIYRLDNNGAPLRRRDLHMSPVDTLSFIQKEGMPVVEVRVGGQAIQVGLDSGAGANILEKKRKPQTGLIEMGRKELAGFGTATKTAPWVQINELEVGKIKCEPMQTLLVSLKDLNFNSRGGDIDGIMGYEFLSRYRTAINFRKKEIYIWDAPVVQKQFAALQSGKVGEKKY
jgi:Aspartyl protease